MARTSRETRTNRPAAEAAGRQGPWPKGRPAGGAVQPARRPIITATCTTPCSRPPSGCWSATGWPGLTLRAVAREAGVSHAAPTHHFGDLTGLLSELAAIGFRRFNEAMVAAGKTETHPLMKALARAKAYVAYAQAHPGMYGLMFRTERLDMTRPSLHEAASASFAGLAERDRRQPQREAHRRGARRCRWTRPRRSRARGRWCTASPRCCSTAG